MHGENCWQGWGRLVGADDVVSIVDRMCTHKPSKNGGKNVDIYSYVAIEPYNLAGKDRMYSYVRQLQDMFLAGNSRTSAASILHVRGCNFGGRYFGAAGKPEATSYDTVRTIHHDRRPSTLDSGPSTDATATAHQFHHYH